MDRCGTVDIARQARKSARRYVTPSGTRSDDACRALAAALRVAPGGPPAASKRLPDVLTSRRALFLACRAIAAVPHLSMVRSPG